MAVKIVTFWSTLIRYAHDYGQAKLSGDPERIAAAQAKLEEYEALCLREDVEMKLDAPLKSKSKSKAMSEYWT